MHAATSRPSLSPHHRPCTLQSRQTRSRTAVCCAVNTSYCELTNVNQDSDLFYSGDDRISSPQRPWMSAPAEILWHIFTLALPQAHIETTNSLQPICNVAPFNVAQVCHQWREASLAKSDLWSHWCIEIDSASPETVRRLTKLLRALNDRSGNAPVVAYIGIVPATLFELRPAENMPLMDFTFGDPEMKSALDELIAFLKGLSSRWKRIGYHTAPKDDTPHRILDPGMQPLLIQSSGDL